MTYTRQQQEKQFFRKISFEVLHNQTSVESL